MVLLEQVNIHLTDSQNIHMCVGNVETRPNACTVSPE
nr:MAG TPA: hypothetical protein [Caudoviricetes sp.]